MLAFVAVAAASREVQGGKSVLKKGTVLPGSIKDEVLTLAETQHGSGGYGGGQDQAFVVSSGYKVADGVLDGTFGGVSHSGPGAIGSHGSQG